MGAIAGGGVAAFILRGYVQSLEQALPLAFFLPMLLSVVGGFVAQSLVASGRSVAMDGRGVWTIVGREVALGLLVGVLAGALVMILVSVFMGTLGWGSCWGPAWPRRCLSPAPSGALLPLLLKRAGVDPTWASSAVLDPVVIGDQRLYLS